jgi:iron(III) transport system substrate-binding protein
MYKFVVVFISLWSALVQADKKQIWVYTSIYKEFATPIKSAFEKKNPDVDVEIFQGGSEKLQSKVEAELISKKLQVDILLTSDPFWSHDLDSRGLIFHRTNHQGVETNYYSMMVLICHKNVPVDQRPTSFQDLTKPIFKSVIQSGSPLESGTSFTAVAYLSEKYGWDYFKKLRDLDLASSGGNSTVIQKVESGEKKIGIVLLENALAARKRGSPIDIIYPSDGSIPIPSVQAIFNGTKQKDATSKFADFILSKEGQELLRAGYMYSILGGVEPPEGARPFKEITKNSMPMTSNFIESVTKNSKSIKKQFSEIVLQ